MLQQDLHLTARIKLYYDVFIPETAQQKAPLLVGYYKHSRGRLSKEHLPALWIGTAVYNFILLLPVLYLASSLLQSRTAGDGRIFYFLVVGSIVFGYLAAIISSLKAYSFEKRKKYL